MLEKTLQRRLSFALLCFHAFLLPSEYVWLSPSCLSVKTFSFMSIYFFAFDPLKRFRLAFSFLCVGEDVFIHSSRLKRAGVLGGGAAPPSICNEGAPSKRASKAISQGISCCVVEKISLLF